MNDYTGLVDMWCSNGAEYVGAFSMESMLNENVDSPEVVEALLRIRSRETIEECVASGQEMVTLRVYEPPIRMKGVAKSMLSVW